jgi:ribosome-associated protein
MDGEKSESVGKVTVQHLMPELQFSTARSGGPGGQNVNKVNSKVIVKFDIGSSPLLTDDQKNVLREKLKTRITTEGVLVLSSQETRSQLDNKEAVIRKLDQLLAKAFEQKKRRKKTKPNAQAKQKRLEEKKKKSEKKAWRQKL